MQVIYNAGSDVTGTGVRVQGVTLQQGSSPIDGTFTLAYNGVTTDGVRYDQTPLELKYMLESTGKLFPITFTDILNRKNTSVFSLFVILIVYITKFLIDRFDCSQELLGRCMFPLSLD